MKAAVLLAIFSACIVLAQEDKCDALTDERGCLMGDCNWCASISVPSSCHSYDVASKLPPSDFNCGNYSRTDCRDSTTNATCMKAIGCAWCSSKTVKNSCNNALNASHLPPSVFQCDWA